jgi:AbrB family looped-hinge helix DNA binding protein
VPRLPADDKFKNRQFAFLEALDGPERCSYNLTGKIIVIEDNLMSNPATTRMSSKGQVVIPEEIRTKLRLKLGSRFVVVGQRDVVILKILSPPSMEQFDDLIAESRRQAKRAGIKRSDVSAAVKRVRS